MAAQINLDEAQQILREESLRVRGQDLSQYFIQTVPEGLEGPPLKMTAVRKLCPNYFVRGTLFRISGRAKDSAPPKLSDLQHVGLARTLLLRFIQKERMLPNNNQIAIYFIQQCYVQDILKKEVDWDDKPRNAGVGKGRIAEKMQAERAEEPQPPRKRPYVLLPEEHDVVVAITQEAGDLFTQGATIRQQRLRNEELEQRVLDMEQRLLDMERELNRYRELHGPLPEEPINSEDVEVDLDNLATFLD